MKQIVIKKENTSDGFLYEQLYWEMKKQIIDGDMVPLEKCPSIRKLATDLNISVTTVMQTYNQLLAEGYIKNKPGSGYYVERIVTSDSDDVNTEWEGDYYNSDLINKTSQYMYDRDSFDFARWKKCASKIYTEYSDSLLFGSDLKGEYALRTEIAKYLFQSRGVKTDPDNIIIAAGTQQIVFNLSRILKKKGVNLVSLEKPCYSPVKSMFIDSGFQTVDIPITDLGINIESLPGNISSAVYVSPSNQFPTGVVMPVARRYEIMDWANKNKGYIIEDDYNSELRYFGKPLPTIKSLDKGDRVIYLGSFSSTLFSAIRISYMVLPKELMQAFEAMKKNYSQTCSKAEQLILAYYMSMGYYYTSIRKKRVLYTKKLKETIDAFEKNKYKGIELTNTNSGLFVTIRIKSEIDINEYMNIAKELQVYTEYIDEISDDSVKCISLYYSYIPLSQIENIMSQLIEKWRKL